MTLEFAKSSIDVRGEGGKGQRRGRRNHHDGRPSPLLLASMLLLDLLTTAAAIPMQVTINQRATECIYDKLSADEHVTTSVFITSGAELRATAIFEGPVALLEDVVTGKDLQTAINNYQMGHRYNMANTQQQQQQKGKVSHVFYEDVVDFEHLNPALVEDDDEEDDEEDEEEDEEEGISEAEKQRRARAREARERRKKMERARLAKMENVRAEGEPFQRTVQVTSPGWYRLCVRGSWYQITAEMEMRKSSELGGIDPETSHVYSYEHRAMLKEESEYEQLDKDQSLSSIKDEDFEQTKDQLRRLRRILAEIQRKQMDERHRLMVHAATNEHSHSRMVLSSLLETILFMGVTGFQVYTIRKWFQGAPILGR